MDEPAPGSAPVERVTSSPYPQRWAADVVLSDGGTVRVRPVRAEDAAEVAAFHERQSPDSVYFRYFTAMPRLTPRMLENLTKIDYVDRMGFVAELGDEIVGMAAYDTWPDRSASEVSFMVDDHHQGRGLATVLLEYLVVAAREAGLGALTAMVLPTNRRMLAVFAKAGFEEGRTFADGVIEVRMAIEPTAEAAALIDERERRAAARSVEGILQPRSIAVIGAGREPGGLGHELFTNLLRNGFEGPVYPVNPSGGHVASVRAWPSILDVPDDVDLAVLAVPAEATFEVVEQCARKRVRGLLVTSAGFAHSSTIAGDPPTLSVPAVDPDAAPAPTPAALLEMARRWGMRLIGPESLGALNTAPGISMTATFAPVDVAAGNVGFLSQSGTLGVAALALARRMGVGISTFVDLGSKVDVSGNDILNYWEQDERTRVALLYLESFGNPAKFVRIARRMGRTTPIVALKAGNERPDVRTLGAHQDAPQWPTDATYGALLAQCGVIRVDTIRQLFDVARVALHQPVPRGRRVAVVSNSRGATAMTRDAAVGAGLEMATLTARTANEVAGEVPGALIASGAIELPFDAGPSDYEAAVRAVQDDDGTDALVIVYAPATRDRRAAVARAIGSVDGQRLPTVATFLGAATDAPLVSGAVAIPLFEFPGEAIRALGRLADYGAWLDEPLGTVPEGPPDEVALDDARAVLVDVLADAPDGRWMHWSEIEAFAAALRLPLATAQLVDDADAACRAAQLVGYPVVLKATGVPAYFRSEEGGVALDLRSAAEVQAAYERMAQNLGEALRPALVQHMVQPGVDVLMAFHQHPRVGAVASVGLGGIAGIGGIGAGGSPNAGSTGGAIRLVPLSDLDAERVVEASAVAMPLRAADPSGRATQQLAGLLVHVSSCLEQLHEVADLVANPVIVGVEEASLTDLRVRVAPTHADGAPAVRRL